MIFLAPMIAATAKTIFVKTVTTVVATKIANDAYDKLTRSEKKNNNRRNRS